MVKLCIFYGHKLFIFSIKVAQATTAAAFAKKLQNWPKDEKGVAVYSIKEEIIIFNEGLQKFIKYRCPNGE